MSKTILVLAANPKDTSRLRLDQEVREIDNGLRRAQGQDEFILRSVLAARPVDVRRAMLDLTPNIVHFCGHGGGKEGIAFEDESGNSKLIGAETLAGFFELFADKVECVVLNACYSKLQAEAIAQHINYVVGMRKGIGDAAAIGFAVAFYDALGAGKSIEFAYKLACNAIRWVSIPERLTPVLIKKPPSSESDKKDFWQIFLNRVSPSENIYIVLSAKQGFEYEQGNPTPKPGHTAYLSYNEVGAFLKLQHMLQQTRERLILVHGGIEDPWGEGTSIPEFPEDGTLIIIGSPNAHKFCQRILSSPKLPQLPFRFEMNEKGKCINVYQDERSEWSEQPLISFPSLTDELNTREDVLEEDFGIILRIANPVDASGKNKVLITGGNHSFGTESAVSFVADKERVKLLNDIVQGNDFEVLFQASVGRKHGLRLGIRRLAILKNGAWQSVNIP